MKNLKKKTNLNPNFVSVEFDFLVAKGITTVTLQIFDFLEKLDSAY